MRCDLVPSRLEERLDRFLLRLCIPGVRLGRPEIELIRLAGSHQPTSDHLAREHLVFALLNGEPVEIGMRIRVVAENGAGNNPLLKQRCALRGTRRAVTLRARRSRFVIA
jgi:hypothetical protein